MNVKRKMSNEAIDKEIKRLTEIKGTQPTKESAMTEIVDSMKCVHCGKQRNTDNRTPCEHCGLRKRDKGGKAKPTDTRIEGKDLVVIASDPEEMVQAQNLMIARLDEKIVAAQRELEAANSAVPAEAVELAGESETARGLIARAHERLAESSKKLAKIAQRRLVYLQKVRAALQAGYVMMPNFPGHVIAVRTARKGPPRKWLFDQSPNADAPVVLPDATTPPGEGKYVAPIPEHEHNMNGAGSSARQDIQIHGFDDEIALPVEFLKPEVVQRTAAAIDLKIFDEIVIVRDGEARDSYAGQQAPPRGRDPMVVGRIVLRKPGSTRWERPRVLSFLIAWFMDTALI